uniref:Uncharacterized protein n=1 Tax=Arundo donax TaxID=35708 RepID=A0A0A9DJI0_ARUDO
MDKLDEEPFVDSFSFHSSRVNRRCSPSSPPAPILSSCAFSRPINSSMDIFWTSPNCSIVDTICRKRLGIARRNFLLTYASSNDSPSSQILLT